MDMPTQWSSMDSWESLARHTKSEIKCLGEKNLSPCSSCMTAVSTAANFCKPSGSNASGSTRSKGRTANLRLLKAQQRQWAPQILGSAQRSWCSAKAEGNTLQPQDEHSGRQGGSTHPWTNQNSGKASLLLPFSSWPRPQPHILQETNGSENQAPLKSSC